MSDKAVFDLEQGHGNYFDCITEESDRDELVKQLPEMLQRAKLTVSPGALIPCSLGEGYPRQLQCAMLADSEDALHLNMLIGLNINGERNELISFYPEMNGSEISVTLTTIHEWGNGLEATLEGTICNGEHHIAFFDTRYIAHKGKYKIGETYTFRVAALAGDCERLENPTFTMEGQQAIDFKAKLGEKPDYDENGNVKPLVFDMSGMVAFLQHSVAYPHVAEFQSPAVAVSVEKAWNREYYSIKIAVAHDEDDNEVCIPLIAKKSFFKGDLSSGSPIRGIAYVMGFLP